MTSAYDRYNVHVHRHNNLVYMATLKCASTFYSTLLMDNGWSRSSFDEIDWQRDHVFGFLSNPVRRWAQGIQEDIQNEESRSFTNTAYEVIENYWSHCFLVTRHSLPVTTALGDRAYQIDWIPLVDKTSNYPQFQKLCKKYGLNVEPGENTDSHHSSSDKVLEVDDIERKFKTGNVMWELFLQRDIDLYNNVCNNFNPQGATWDEMSWLRNARNR